MSSGTKGKKKEESLDKPNQNGRLLKMIKKLDAKTVWLFVLIGLLVLAGIAAIAMAIIGLVGNEKLEDHSSNINDKLILMNQTFVVMIQHIQNEIDYLKQQINNNNSSSGGGGGCSSNCVSQTTFNSTISNIDSKIQSLPQVFLTISEFMEFSTESIHNVTSLQVSVGELQSCCSNEVNFVTEMEFDQFKSESIANVTKSQQDISNLENGGGGNTDNFVTNSQFQVFASTSIFNVTSLQTSVQGCCGAQDSFVTEQEFIDYKTQVSSEFVTGGELQGNLTSYVSLTTFSSTLGGYATTASLSSYALASEVTDLGSDVNDLQDVFENDVYYASASNMTIYQDDTWTLSLKSGEGIFPWTNSHSQSLVWTIISPGGCTPGNTQFFGSGMLGFVQDPTILDGGGFPINTLGFCPCVSGYYIVSASITDYKLERDPDSGSQTGQNFWGFIDPVGQTEGKALFFSEQLPPIISYTWPPNIGNNFDSGNGKYIQVSQSGNSYSYYSAGTCYYFVHVVKDDITNSEVDYTMKSTQISSSNLSIQLVNRFPPS
jgi:hypothetical protein